MRAGLSICIVFLGALLGCSSSSASTRPARSYELPSLPDRPSFDATVPAAPSEGGICAIDPSACPNGATIDRLVSTPVRAEVYAVQQSGSGAGAVRRTIRDLSNVVAGNAGYSFSSSSASSGASAASTVALPAAAAATSEEKIEREARLAIEVKDVNEGAARVLALVRAHDGSVTKDQRSSGTQSNAEIIVRVPSAHFDAFTNELSSVGQIRNSSIKALDTTLEHKDLGILVDNLEAALARYRSLLDKATDPLQVLAVERELERVRSDLDRIKGRLSFLRDRVARATVAIALHSPEALPDVQPGHRPQISAGVRGLTFIDVRESGTSGYLGSGLTLRLPRSGGGNARGLILDVDVMRSCCKSRPERSNWAYDILLGYDLYSESLQSGRRRFLNPYLGARIGFSQTQNRGDFAAAGVFGLELVRTAVLMIDIQARAMALVGNPDGPHAAVQPSLGFDLGF
jgi:hypothetical protein